ncbi:hypothetical protein DD595_26025, partial [Enterobacter cloacae complex sp. 4DZ3-17B2]|uniref:chromo domain-containing protein n=1 Tax=Enterobacter cloacae complex sp. 4DZ3-17B2 TaxID=2511990 RepID=UPI0010273B2C
SRAKNVFAEGYEGGWTEELFKITRVSNTRQPVVYNLEDLQGEEIDGFFYEEKLSRVQRDLNTEVFLVEKILKTTGIGRKKKYFVRWVGYPDKFNSWVSAGDLKKNS